jgi:hypothetical protein
MRRRNVEQQLLLEGLAQVRHQMQSYTEMAARLGGQLVNDVLEVYSGVFDADGRWTRQYHVAAGSVVVRNLVATAGHNIVVSSAGPGGTGGVSSGTGTWIVPPSTIDTVAVASRSITLYGTVGEAFCVQVSTRAITPSTA